MKRRYLSILALSISMTNLQVQASTLKSALTFLTTYIISTHTEAIGESNMTSVDEYNPILNGVPIGSSCTYYSDCNTYMCGANMKCCQYFSGSQSVCSNPAGCCVPYVCIGGKCANPPMSLDLTKSEKTKSTREYSRSNVQFRVKNKAKHAIKDEYCSNLWAPINTMQLGVDLTYFDLYSENPGWSTYPLIQYTCNKNLTWINDVNKVQYNIPDQLAEAPIAIPTDVTVTTTSQNMNTHQLEESMSASLSESYVFGLFSGSASVSEAFEAITVKDTFLTTINSSASSFRVNIISYEIDPNAVQLSDEAKEFIENNIFPSGGIFNDDTAENFYKFFSFFGTHFFQTAHTGGSFHMRCETSKFLFSEMSQASISAQGQINFMNFLKKSGAVSGSAEQLDARYVAMTTTVEECKGGTFCPVNSNDYDNWQISVASLPWILSAQFTPMYHLLSFNKTFQNSFQLAIQNHQNFAFLSEITLNINNALSLVNSGLSLQCGGPRTDCGTIPKSIKTSCDVGNTNSNNCPRYQYVAKETVVYHSWVTPSTFSSFQHNLTLVQQLLQKYVSQIKVNVATINKNNTIVNQTLFDETANLWNTVVYATQGNYYSDYIKYTSTSLCGPFWVNYKFAQCYSVEIPETILIYNNLTYFQYWLQLFSLI